MTRFSTPAARAFADPLAERVLQQNAQYGMHKDLIEKARLEAHNEAVCDELEARIGNLVRREASAGRIGSLRRGRAA